MRAALPCFFAPGFFAFVADACGVSSYDEPEYPQEYVVRVEVGAGWVADGDFGQRGLRPVPQVGAGVGACVVEDGDGLTFVGDGDGLVVFLGAVVVFGAVVGSAVGRALLPVDVGGRTSLPVSTVFGGAVEAGATVVGAALGLGAVVVDGVSLTSTLRVSWSLPPPKCDGITVSGRPWKPMTTSRPVAAVASMTMTTLESSGPRCALLRLTVATSPGASVRAFATPIGRNLN